MRSIRQDLHSDLSIKYGTVGVVGLEGDQAVGENSIFPGVRSFGVGWLGVIDYRPAVHFDDDPLARDDDVVFEPLVVFHR